MNKKKLSLKWFKSKIKGQEIKNKILENQLEDVKEEVEEIKNPLEGKPYISLRLVGDILTILLTDGCVLAKSGATVDDFKKAREAKSEFELLLVIATEEVAEEKKTYEKEVIKSRAIQKGTDILIAIDDFVVNNDAVYMNGIQRSLPTLLVEKFMEVIGSCIKDGASILEIREILKTNEQYQALKKFWLKCCLNPNAQSAEDLYTFLSNHEFKIDKHGNFYAYRRVVSLQSETAELVEFIGNVYNKVKAVWKKRAKDFEVCTDESGDYTIEKTNSEGVYQGDWIGNLDTLYSELPNRIENRYTDAHTRSFDYRIGQSISMPRHMGDDDNRVNCSRGSNWGPLVK